MASAGAAGRPLVRVASTATWQRVGDESVLVDARTRQVVGLDALATEVLDLSIERRPGGLETLAARRQLDVSVLDHEITDLVGRLSALGLLEEAIARPVGRSAVVTVPQVVSVRDLVVGPSAGVVIPDLPPVETRHGDGSVWRRVWSRPGGLLVEFVGVARAAVEGSVVTFDRHLDAEIAEHLVLDHLAPLVLAAQGALVLHGASVGRRGEAVLVLGASGVGKSTLAGFCAKQGWAVGGDDAAVVQPASMTVSAVHPTLRLTEESRAIVGVAGERSMSASGKRRYASVDGNSIGAPPMPLVAAVQLTAGAGEGDLLLERMSGVEAFAAMLAGVFHVGLDADSLPSICQQIAATVERLDVRRMRVPRSARGLEQAESALVHLVDGRHLPSL